MYERRVDEPRLVAVFEDALPARVEQVRAELTVRKRVTDPVVATVPLGERRRFLLRRRGGGPTALSLLPGEGDLVVMGGACQHDWEHTVPKVGSAGARMSVTLRHSAPHSG